LKIFWKLVEKSVIFRGTLAIITTSAAVFLMCTDRDVPPLLAGLVGMAWSWFFASGALRDIQQVAEKK
jgi:hypothetical protein